MIYLQVKPLDADVTPDYLLPLQRKISTVTVASRKIANGAAASIRPLVLDAQRVACQLYDCHIATVNRTFCKRRPCQEKLPWKLSSKLSWNYWFAGRFAPSSPLSLETSHEDSRTPRRARICSLAIIPVSCALHTDQVQREPVS